MEESTKNKRRKKKHKKEKENETNSIKKFENNLHNLEIQFHKREFHRCVTRESPNQLYHLQELSHLNKSDWEIQFELAKLYYNNDKHEKALIHINIAISNDFSGSNKIQNNLLKGKICYALKQYEDAVKLFLMVSNESIDGSSDDNVAVLTYIALSYACLDKPEFVKKYLTLAMKVPDESNNVIRIFQNNIKGTQFEQRYNDDYFAILKIKCAPNLTEKVYELFSRAADHYTTTDNLETVLEICEDAITLLENPSNKNKFNDAMLLEFKHTLHEFYGHLLFILNKKLNVAERHLQNAISDVTESDSKECLSHYHSSLGLFYLCAQNNSELAMQNFELALQLDSDNIQALLVHSFLILTTTNEYEKGMFLLRRMIKEELPFTFDDNLLKRIVESTKTILFIKADCCL